MRTKMVQRREPMALSQDSKTPALLLPLAKSWTASRPGQMQVNWAWLPVPQNTYAPLPSTHGGLSHYFPRCVAQLTEHGWMLKGTTGYKPWDFAEKCTHTHKWEQEASSGVHYTYPQPKKKDEQQPQKRETPHDSWNHSPLIRIDRAAATRLIVFFLEQCWKSLKRQ